MHFHHHHHHHCDCNKPQQYLQYSEVEKFLDTHNCHQIKKAISVQLLNEPFREQTSEKGPSSFASLILGYDLYLSRYTPLNEQFLKDALTYYRAVFMNEMEQVATKRCDHQCADCKDCCNTTYAQHAKLIEMMTNKDKLLYTPEIELLYKGYVDFLYNMHLVYENAHEEVPCYRIIEQLSSFKNFDNIFNVYGHDQYAYDKITNDYNKDIDFYDEHAAIPAWVLPKKPIPSYQHCDWDDCHHFDDFRPHQNNLFPHPENHCGYIIEPPCPPPHRPKPVPALLKPIHGYGHRPPPPPPPGVIIGGPDPMLKPNDHIHDWDEDGDGWYETDIDLEPPPQIEHHKPPRPPKHHHP